MSKNDSCGEYIADRLKAALDELEQASDRASANKATGNLERTLDELIALLQNGKQ